MNVKRFIAASLAVFVVGQVRGFVIHGAILWATYDSLKSVWRPDMKSKMWIILKLRGAKVITCPETQQPATVEVNAIRAALMLLVGAQSLRLKGCSRWPRRRECGQQCVRQLGRASEPGVVI